MVKKLPTKAEMQVRFLGWEDLLDEEMATPSSILAWRFSWTEEPGGIQSMGLQRVGHDLATKQQQQQTSQKNVHELITHTTDPLPHSVFKNLFLKAIGQFRHFEH